MFSYKVKYGLDVASRQSETPVTVGQIKADEGLRIELGYGDNVNLLVKGVTLPVDAIVPNDAMVVIETAANQKA